MLNTSKLPIRPQGVFITGTDTNIGKTFVSSLMVSSLRSHGHAVGYFKPIQTGVTPETPSDLQTVTLLSTLLAEEQEPSVYNFPQALAPSQAAILNREEIQINLISKRWNNLATGSRSWVVEGAGGLLVPLNSRQTIRDLILALEIRVILVIATRLGTINHTLLTLEVAKVSGIEIAGLVLVGHDAPGLKETLQNFTETPILAEIPWFPVITSATIKNHCTRYFPAALFNQILAR